MPDLFERAAALVKKEQNLLERRYASLDLEASPEADPGEVPDVDLVTANERFDATVLPSRTRARFLKGLVLRILGVFTSGQVIWNAAVVRLLNALERRSREVESLSRRRSATLAERLKQVEERRELWETRLLERIEIVTCRLSAIEVANAVATSREGVQGYDVTALGETVSRLEADAARWRASGADHEEIRASVDRLQAVVAGLRSFSERQEDPSAGSLGPRERFLVAGLSLPPRVESVARCRPFLRPLQKAAARLGPESAFLDLQCGRGDLLEAARAAGLLLAGRDANPVAVYHCRSLGFDVREGDPRAALEEVIDGALAGISALHVVESLPLEEVRALLKLAHRKLRRGGILVLSALDPGTITGLLALHAGPGTRTPFAEPFVTYLLNEAGFLEVAPVPEDAEGSAHEPWVTPYGRPEYGVVGTKS